MRCTALLIGLLGAACYQPTIPTGAPCSTNATCPGELRCIDGYCGGRSVDGGAVDAPVDTTMIDAPPAWGAPQLLATVNSPTDDTDPEIRADGLELLFASRRSGDWEIWRATRASLADDFDAPELVAGVNSTSYEFSPALADGGLTLYLDRDSDMFRATRPALSAPFGTAVLEATLSSIEDETDPAFSADGRVAIIARVVGGNQALYQHTRTGAGEPWSAPVLVGELDSAVIEGGPWLDAAGRTILFHSTRSGSRDLFTATRASGAASFSTAVPLDELNTVAGDEGNPSLTADQRILVFERGGDLYITTR